MKLTCVTATYNCMKAGNRERLIRCVESVAKLKTEHEHLIYDGASTDGTVELLRELEAKTPGLKVVSEPDTGIYNALNKGVRDAKGEWFYVLGADDYILHPEVMDALLAEYNSDEIVTPAEIKYGLRPVTTKKIFINMPYCHQGVIQKTAAIRRFGAFDEQYAIASDFKLILQFHEAGLDIRYDDRVFAYFGGDGMSSTSTDETIVEYANIVATHFRISEVRAAKMCRRGYISIRLAWPYFSHKDAAFRTAAWNTIYESIKDCLRVVLYPIVIARRRIRARWAGRMRKAG